MENKRKTTKKKKKITTLIKEDCHYCVLSLNDSKDEYEIVFDFNFEEIEKMYPDLALKFLYSVINRFTVYFGQLKIYSNFIPKTPIEIKEKYSFPFIKDVENLDKSKENILNAFNKMVEDFKLTETTLKEAHELYARNSKD